MIKLLKYLLVVIPTFIHVRAQFQGPDAALDTSYKFMPPKLLIHPDNDPKVDKTIVDLQPINTIYVRDPSVVASPSTYSLVVLKCDASAFETRSISFDWYKDDFQVDTSLSQTRYSWSSTDKTLTFSVSDLQFYGTYDCRPRNQYGVVRSRSITLKILLFFETSQQMELPPETVNVFQYDYIKLSCADKGLCNTFSPGTKAKSPTCFDPFFFDPYFEVKNDLPQAINLKPGYALDSSTGDIHILSTDSANMPSSTINCKFFSRRVGINDPAYTFRYNLKVNPRSTPTDPMVRGLAFATPTLRNVTIREGDKLALSCAFYGYPVPVTSWETPAGTSCSGITCSIPQMTKPKEGYYKCSGKAQLNSRTSNFQEFPTWKVTVVRNPTAIMPPPQQLKRTVGQSVDLTCDAGNALLDDPSIKVELYKNDVLMDPSRFAGVWAPIPGTTIYKGTIRSVNTDDQASYTCMVKSIVGTAIDSTVLFVYDETRLKLYVNGTEWTNNAKVQLTSFQDTVVANCNATKDSRFSFLQADNSPNNDQPILWYLKNKILNADENKRVFSPDNRQMSIYLSHYENNTFVPILGTYTCTVRTVLGNYSQSFVLPGELVKLNKPGSVKPNALAIEYGGPGSDTTAIEQAGFPLWILGVILGVIVLAILLFIVIFLMRRQKAGTYLLDAKEREQGNDPEKELKMNAFSEYIRPDQDPRKGTRASMEGVDQVGTDDEDNLDQYAEIEQTGHFNEDGSFIGAYSEKQAASSGQGSGKHRKAQGHDRNGDHGGIRSPPSATARAPLLAHEQGSPV